jgi:hypothetical protein
LPSPFSVASNQKPIARCVFLLVSVMASVATAATADVVAADELLREGKALFEQKKFAEACPKLSESNRLDPSAGTMLALAICHEAQGKTASAWAEYGDAADRGREEGHPEIERAAGTRRDAIEPKLPRLTIVPSTLAAATVGLYVKRDGVFVAGADLGASVPVDPGEHHLEATAPGKRAFTADITLQPGERKTVDIPGLRNEGGDSAPPPAERRSALSGLTGMEVAGVATGAAGVVALGVGTYFGLHARKLNEDSKAGCDGDACFPDARQQRLDAISAGNWSTLAFIVGGVLVAGGATLFVLGRSRESGLQVAATGSADGGTLFVAGRF